MSRVWTPTDADIQSKKANLSLGEFLALLRLGDVGGAQRQGQRGARWIPHAEDPRPLHLVLTGHGSEAVPPHRHFLSAVGLHTRNSQGEEKDKHHEHMLASKQGSLHTEKWTSGTSREKNGLNKKTLAGRSVGRVPEKMTCSLCFYSFTRLLRLYRILSAWCIKESKGVFTHLIIHLSFN